MRIQIPTSTISPLIKESLRDSTKSANAKGSASTLNLSSDAGPLVQLGGGEYVLVEMQGVVELQGDERGQILGKLDLSVLVSPRS